MSPQAQSFTRSFIEWVALPDVPKPRILGFHKSCVVSVPREQLAEDLVPDELETASDHVPCEK
eukprot:3147563-Prorocentrum_lima.AAC.1